MNGGMGGGMRIWTVIAVLVLVLLVVLMNKLSTKQLCIHDPRDLGQSPSSR